MEEDGNKGADQSPSSVVEGSAATPASPNPPASPPVAGKEAPAAAGREGADPEVAALQEENRRLKTDLAARDARIAELEAREQSAAGVPDASPALAAAQARIASLEAELASRQAAGAGSVASPGAGAFGSLKSDLKAVRERLSLIKQEQRAAEERKKQAWEELKECVSELSSLATSGGAGVKA